MCVLGWCEIKLLLKSPNPQADYGSIKIAEQLLSKVVAHRMYKHHGFRKDPFISSSTDVILVYNVKWRENNQITKKIIKSELKV